jgi:AcrR family transcriptional regulator
MNLVTDDDPSLPRSPLSRHRLIAAAMEIADAGGLATLTMRSLATAVGVTPMSLYHHVRNKDEILDALVDAVFAEIALPEPGGDWRAEIRKRSHSAREVLGRHPWAVGLLESRRAPGPANLGHHEAMLAVLREAGFSLSLTAHAYALLDSHVFGFAVQEASLPFSDSPQTIAAAAAHFQDLVPAETYPRMVEFMTDYMMQPGYRFGDEFAWGLELILEALETRLTRERA